MTEPYRLPIEVSEDALTLLNNHKKVSETGGACSDSELMYRFLHSLSEKTRNSLSFDDLYDLIDALEDDVSVANPETDREFVQRIKRSASKMENVKFSEIKVLANLAEHALTARAKKKER
ncbi:MAG: hypothetical protein ABF586_13545 [Sporolactobacillus sp.]